MKRISFISLLILLFTACEKDADIDIQEMDPVPVIEGEFSNFGPDSFFKVSMSKGFERNGYQYEQVTDAQLSITDSQGQVINFYPDNDGVYRTTSNGIPGETYTLELIRGNNRVTAESKMPTVVQITDFEFMIQQSTNGTDEDKCKLYFNDPDNQRDYYMLRVYYNSGGSYYDTQPPVYFNDRNYDKSEHAITLSGIYYNGAGIYKIKLFHLNKSYIDYLNTLDRLGGIGYGESPFQTAVPGNPETNVRGGIGYFATVASDSLVKLIN